MRGYNKCAGRHPVIIIGLLLAWIMAAVPVSAGEISVNGEKFTNLIVVVDCSKSMQSSDSSWKVPESLAFLINACPADDAIRFSMVLYGSESDVVIRDMPLSEENKEYLIETVRKEIRNTEYKLKGTDTGNALQDVQRILESKDGQKSSVILITDGRIETKKEGRTAADSQREVLEFASYAQDHDCRIDVMALPRKGDSADVRAAIKEELNELTRKTGGSYHDVDSLEFVPELLLGFLMETLEVKAFVPEPERAAAEDMVDGADGSSFVKLSLPVDTELISSVTLLINGIQAGRNHVLLKSPEGSWYEVAGSGISAAGLPEAPGASRIAENGYEILQIDRGGFDTWLGEWELYLPANMMNAKLCAFYVYDVGLVLEIDDENPGVMETTAIRAYLVTDDGIVVDDLDFTKKLRASIKIVNTASRSVEKREVSERGDEAELEASLSLKGYEYVYMFTPERTSEYVVEVTVQTDIFEKTVVSIPITVQDRLSLVSTLRQREPKKNQETTILAYLMTSDHQMVEGVAYYEMSGIYATAVNQQTQAEQRIDMICMEDGTGVYGVFVPEEAGTYEIVVRMNSVREKEERCADPISFDIEDQLPYISEKQLPSLPVLIKGMEYRVDLNRIFADDDGDVLHYPVIECLQGGFWGKEYQGIMDFGSLESGKIVFRVVAEDNYGNSVEWVQEKLCMTMFEALMAGLAGAVVLVVLVILVFDAYCRACRMNGMLEMEIIYNDAEQVMELAEEYREGTMGLDNFPERHMGSVIISLADQHGRTHFWMKRKFLHKRVYPLSGLLENFRKRYVAAYGANDSDEILKKFAADCGGIGFTTGLTDNCVALHKNGADFVKWDTGYRNIGARKLQKGKSGILLFKMRGENAAAAWKIRITYF